MKTTKRIFLVTASAFLFFATHLFGQGIPGNASVTMPQFHLQNGIAIPTYAEVKRREEQDALSSSGASKKIKAHNSPKRSARILYWTAVAYDAGSCVFDAKSTSYVINHGGHELDPLLTAFGNRNKIGIFASSALWQVAFTFATEHFLYSRGHPKIAAAAHLLSGSSHIAFGAHNYHLYGH